MKTKSRLWTSTSLHHTLLCSVLVKQATVTTDLHLVIPKMQFISLGLSAQRIYLAFEQSHCCPEGSRILRCKAIDMLGERRSTTETQIVTESISSWH